MQIAREQAPPPHCFFYMCVVVLLCRLSHLCTLGEPTVALSNHPSSLSVGNTRPRLEVYSPMGEEEDEEEAIISP